MSGSFSVSSVCSVVKKSVAYQFPEAASFGRVLPKTKIYEHSTMGKAVKELFVRQVDQIVWQYKLAPETINLKPSQSVPEIQVFCITLKTGELKQDVLRCVDQAIPFPILFELRRGDELQTVAAFKRPSEADSSKWVGGEYFESAWMPIDAPREPLPLTLSLEFLYEALLRRLLPVAGDEPLSCLIERAAAARALEREAEMLRRQMAKEKQFNRKVELNRALNEVLQEKAALLNGSYGSNGSNEPYTSNSSYSSHNSHGVPQ